MDDILDLLGPAPTSLEEFAGAKDLPKRRQGKQSNKTKWKRRRNARPKAKGEELARENEALRLLETK